MKNDDQHPTILESLAAGLLLGIVGSWIFYYGFIQATGGF